MANNYFQGTVLPYLPLTEQQKDLFSWDIDDAIIDEDGNLHDDSPLTDEDRKRIELDKLAYSLGFNEDSLLRGVEWDPGYGKDEGLYYLYFEDGYYGDALENFLLHLLKTLPEDAYPWIYIESAYTCSKMRSGEFGGSATFITREKGIEYHSTDAWIASKKAELAVSIHKNRKGATE